MNQEYLHTAYLFSCGVRGIVPEAGDYNINKILRIALDQSVYPIVFISVKRLYDNNLIELDENIYNFHYSQFFAFVAKRESVTVQAAAAVDELEKNGIKCCILKGESISHMYANPECRVSNDTDILISPEFEDKAMAVLKNAGFTITKRLLHSHHFGAVKGNVHLEVHVMLYNENCHDLWFNGCDEITEEYRTVTTADGREIRTLGINDNFKFVTLHAIKHFLGEGMGIRHLMDVLLYMQYYKDSADMDGYMEFMKKMNFHTLLSHFIGVGIEYFKIPAENLPDVTYDISVVTSLAEDILSGGIFGQTDQSRTGFMELYSQELLAARNTESAHEYLKDNFGVPIKRRIFPLPSYMHTHYPYLNKHPKLLPIAWVHRWFDLIIAILTRKKNLQSLTDIIVIDGNSGKTAERLELIRNLNVLK